MSPVVATPFTKNLWLNKKTITEGISPITEAAIRWCQGIPVSVAVLKRASPIGSVLMLSELVMING